MLLAFGFIVVVLLGAFFVLTIVVPKRIPPPVLTPTRECEADYEPGLGKREFMVRDVLDNLDAPPVGEVQTLPPVCKVVTLPNGMRTLEPWPMGQHEALIVDHGVFDHAPTISYDSLPVATPSESNASGDAGEVRSSSQSAMDEAPASSEGSSGGDE